MKLNRMTEYIIFELYSIFITFFFLLVILLKRVDVIRSIVIRRVVKKEDRKMEW